jgi:hypothetical protein
MCDGEGLGLIQMAMTPVGLAVVAGIAPLPFSSMRAGLSPIERKPGQSSHRPVALVRWYWWPSGSTAPGSAI